MREDHSKVEKGEAKEAQNTVVTVSPKDGSQAVLVGFTVLIINVYP